MNADCCGVRERMEAQRRASQLVIPQERATHASVGIALPITIPRHRRSHPDPYTRTFRVLLRDDT